MQFFSYFIKIETIAMNFGTFFAIWLILCTNQKSYMADSICKSNSKCSYRISRFTENEYLMIKNIMQNLINLHWNITLDYTNFYFHPNTRQCDQYFDYIGINQVLIKDFRHPNALFRNLNESSINKTIKTQYEIEWYEKYKFIKYKLQSPTYLNQCNSLGLKIFLLMYQYPEEKHRILRCNTRFNQEDSITNLIDYYISQSFLKSCSGNIELLAKSIYKLLRYDCERANTFKLAYFNSKYLNLFRACNPNLTANDLMMNGTQFTNCTNSHLNGFLNKKYCTWFEIVCKYPTQCLKSLSWTNE